MEKDKVTLSETRYPCIINCTGYMDLSDTDTVAWYIDEFGYVSPLTANPCVSTSEDYDVVDVTITVTGVMRLYIDRSLTTDQLREDISYSVYTADDAWDACRQGAIEVCHVERNGVDITEEINNVEVQS